MKWQIRIFALSWLAYAAFYFPRSAFSAAKVGILEEGFLTRQTLGLLDSAYLAAYAIGQFVWGACAEKYGTRVVVAGGMVMAAVASLLMGVVPAVALFLPLMIVQGLAQSTGWSALSKNIASFFTISKRGRAMGFFSTSYAFGGLAGAPVTGWVAYSLFDSWRWAFVAGASIIMIAFVLFLIFQRNSPQEVGLPGIDEDPSLLDTEHERGSKSPPGSGTRTKFSASDLLAAVRYDPMVLRLGIVYFLIKPARYAILLWGPVLVLEAMPDLSAMTAIMLPVAFGVTGMIAPVLAGWMSDTVFGARRVPPSVLCLLLMVVALALWQVVTQTGSLPLIVALLAFIGLTAYASDAMISGVAAVDFGTSKYAAGATGFVNGCGSLGAILGGLLPGFFSGIVIFYMFAGAALVAVLVLLPSWNKRPISV
ncbi:MULTISPECIES: MFS transporter [unclassified Arthrobacter]|uniref:MFS transporter n=1 Tax=unclassified Arthrobacter TaxID=235627 RepID=UPI0027D82046|nr:MULTISPECIES: MFS transporter [unclassified Arthrobacter]